MPVETDNAGTGVGSFHVHRGHAFAGFELRCGRLLAALCECGATLDVADAVFAPCAECGGEGAAGCVRCGSTGRIIDHAALEWRLPSD